MSDVLCRELGDEVQTEQPFDGDPPLFITPRDHQLATDPDAAVAWCSAHKELLYQLIARFGAVVLRGLPIHGTAGFAALVAPYPPHGFGYRGGATPRAQLGPNVYEATQVPATVDIKLHQEIAYLHDYPSKLAFFCNVAPESGGETLIGDVRRFERGLGEGFLAKLDELGVTYQRNFRADDRPHGSDDHPKIYHAT